MSESETPLPPDPEVIQRGHEADFVSPRLVIPSAIGLALLMGLALLVADWTRPSLSPESQTGRRMSRSRQTSAGVRVTADQPGQLAALRESEDRRLTTYEWIVEPEGIARIPIERAMEIIAENGLPKPQPGAEEQDENAD